MIKILSKSGNPSRNEQSLKDPSRAEGFLPTFQIPPPASRSALSHALGAFPKDWRIFPFFENPPLGLICAQTLALGANPKARRIFP